MRPLRDFHPKIHPYITGCPEPTLNSALVEAAIRFCQETHVIHQTTLPMPTYAGVGEYEIDTLTDQRVASVRSVWVDGQQLSPVLGDTPKPQTQSSGKPSNYWGRRNDSVFELVLYPTPDDTYEVVLDVVYCPTRSAASLEDDLFELWLEGIRAGTLAALWAIPGQAFSDMPMAAQAAASFNRHIAEAKRRADNSRVIGSHRVRQRPFA